MGKTILIIDDSEIVLDRTSEALKKAGYKTVTARFPDKAEDCLTRLLDEHCPDLILCDVDMPFLSGNDFTFMAKLRPEWGDLKVYLYSGLPVDDLKRFAADTGANGYIPKSEDFGGIVRRVGEILGQEAGHG